MLTKAGVNAGHGGNDRANVGPTGYVEADGNLIMAKYCKAELIRHGVTVTMTREEDKSLSLEERGAIFNNAGCEVAISIHSNAASDPNVHGCLAVYSVTGDGSEQLAETVMAQLSSEVGTPRMNNFSKPLEDNPKRDWYGDIRNTKCIIIIAEVEFHTNPQAEALLKDEKYLAKVGKALAHGMLKYMGIAILPEVAPAPLDPKDQQIKDLQSQVATLQGQVNTLKAIQKQAVDNLLGIQGQLTAQINVFKG